MLINKPGCYVCFQISQYSGERQIQDGRHLFFTEYVILCILPVTIIIDFLLEFASK